MHKVISLLVMAGLLTWQVPSFAGIHMTPRQAFYYHAHKGNSVALERLKSMGHSINMTDEAGDSALCEAIYNQDYSAFALLRQSGASTSHQCVNNVPPETLQEFNQGYTNWANAVNAGLVSYAGQPAAPEPVPESTGLSTAAWIGIGVGAAALVGGGIALAVGGGGGGGGGSKKVCSGHGEKIEGDVCKCNIGYRGENCDECASGYDKYGTNDCYRPKDCGHGVQVGNTCQCTGNWDGSACDTCKAGWTGSDCNTASIDYSCSGHGTWRGMGHIPEHIIGVEEPYVGVEEPYVGGFCDCDNEWDGTYCETCPLRGDNVDSANCKCNDGYERSGNECLIPMPVIKCQNGGTIKYDSGVPVCQCVNEWDGVVCETCPLSGDNVDSANCKCSAGYEPNASKTGCVEQQSISCSGTEYYSDGACHPCLHGGTAAAVAGVTATRCFCPNLNWTGIDCGTCTLQGEHVNQTLCACDSGYEQSGNGCVPSVTSDNTIGGDYAEQGLDDLSTPEPGYYEARGVYFGENDSSSDLSSHFNVVGELNQPVSREIRLTADNNSSEYSTNVKLFGMKSDSTDAIVGNTYAADVMGMISDNAATGIIRLSTYGRHFQSNGYLYGVFSKKEAHNTYRTENSAVQSATGIISLSADASGSEYSAGTNHLVGLYAPRAYNGYGLTEGDVSQIDILLKTPGTGIGMYAPAGTSDSHNILENNGIINLENGSNGTVIGMYVAPYVNATNNGIINIASNSPLGTAYGVYVAEHGTFTNAANGEIRLFDNPDGRHGNFYGIYGENGSTIVNYGKIYIDNTLQYSTSGPVTGQKKYEEGYVYKVGGVTVDPPAAEESIPVISENWLGTSPKTYFTGLEKSGNLTIDDEKETTAGLYEATSGKLYPMVAAYGVLNSNAYANVTVTSSSVLQNTAGGPLVYLQHANLTNSGTLKGNITMESEGTITNTSTGKIDGDITLDGNILNEGEIEGNITLETSTIEALDDIFKNSEDDAFKNSEGAKITGAVSLTNNSDSDFTAENSGQILFSNAAEDKITLAGSGEGDIDFTNTTTGSIKNSLDISKGTLTNNGEIKLEEDSMTFSIKESGQVINTSTGTIDWTDAIVLNGGTLENRGNLSTEMGNIIVKDGTLENKASATLKLSVPETYDNIMTANKIYSNGTVNNAGYLQGIVFSAGSVSNTGTIDGTIEAGGTFDGNDYFSAGTYSAGTVYNNGTINGLITSYEGENTYPAGISMTGDGTFTNDSSGIINGAGLFENRTTKKLTANNYGKMGITTVEGKDKDSISFTNEAGGIINDGVIQVGGTFVNKGTINGGVNLSDWEGEPGNMTTTESVFVNDHNGLINVDMNHFYGVSTLSTGLGNYDNIGLAVLVNGSHKSAKFYNYGTVIVSNGQIVRQIGWDDSASEKVTAGAVIKAIGPKAYVYNEGTLEIKNSTLTTEDYTGSSHTITSVVTLNDSTTANTGSENSYFINLTEGASIINSGYINTGLSSLNTASFSSDGTGKLILMPKAKLISKISIEGNVYMATDFVTDTFDTTVVAKDMIQTPDVSKLNLISDSALFDAKLEGNDVVMKMKGFDTATNNKSLSSFLSKNYSLGNNEGFYNKLKAFGSTHELTDSLNKLTGRDMLSRFNFEDMTMMRELNFDMNEKLFHNQEQHFALAGSVSPMAFRGDTGSNARYSLYNKRDGHKSIGLGIAFTDVRSDNAHDDDNRYETSYQLILPIGYRTNGFNFVTSPRIGYARGTYDRTGFDGSNYDGEIEKRVYGLMNEVRYPITVGKWKLEPSAEFNVLGYQQRGHEDDKEFALRIQNQNTYSVEGGIGLYATREEELDKDSRLKLTAGMAAYHEFADPYRIRVGMNGMDGAFTLRDEKRSDNRGVIRAGFDYSYRDLSLYGSLISYIDREFRTSAKTGMRIRF